jgi:hypothetical protein
MLQCQFMLFYIKCFMLHCSIFPSIYNAIHNTPLKSTWMVLRGVNGRLIKIVPQLPPLPPFPLTMADLVNSYSNPRAEIREHVERRSADLWFFLVSQCLRTIRLFQILKLIWWGLRESSGDWILHGKRIRKPQGSSISVDQPKGRRNVKTSEKQREIALPLIGQHYFQYPQWVGIRTSIVYTHMTAMNNHCVWIRTIRIRKVPFENKHCVGHTNSVVCVVNHMQESHGPYRFRILNILFLVAAQIKI